MENLLFYWKKHFVLRHLVKDIIDVLSIYGR